MAALSGQLLQLGADHDIDVAIGNSRPQSDELWARQRRICCQVTRAIRATWQPLTRKS